MSIRRSDFTTYDWGAIGRTVKQIRMRKELSQQELASLCGVDRSLISKIESGSIVPPLGTLSEVAQALGVSLFQLIDGVEVPKAQGLQVFAWNTREIEHREGYDIGYTYRRVATVDHSVMFHVHVPGDQTPPRRYTHVEREWGYVIRGQCILVYGDQRVPLNMYDGYLIDGRIPHVLEPVDQADCEVLAIFFEAGKEPHG